MCRWCWDLPSAEATGAGIKSDELGLDRVELVGSDDGPVGG